MNYYDYIGVIIDKCIMVDKLTELYYINPHWRAIVLEHDIPLSSVDYFGEILTMSTIRDILQLEVELNNGMKNQSHFINKIISETLVLLQKTTAEQL